MRLYSPIPKHAFTHSVRVTGYAQVRLVNDVKQWPGWTVLMWAGQLPSVSDPTNPDHTAVWDLLALAGWTGASVSGLPPLAWRQQWRLRYLDLAWVFSFSWPVPYDVLADDQFGTADFSGPQHWLEYSSEQNLTVAGLPSPPSLALSAPAAPVYTYGVSTMPVLPVADGGTFPLNLGNAPESTSSVDFLDLDYGFATVAGPGTGLWWPPPCVWGWGLTLSDSYSYTVPLGVLLARLAARPPTDGAWSQGLDGAYPAEAWEAWHEMFDQNTADEAAATGATYQSSSGTPVPGNGNWQPEFYAESSPVRTLPGPHDQTQTLSAMCSWWVYPSQEETYNAGGLLWTEPPLYGQVCRWKADRLVNYWLATAYIPRTYDPGTTGLPKPLAPLVITLLREGVALAGEVVTVPLPTADTFVQVETGAFAGLTVGAMTFCVVNETVAQWTARTGLIVNT